MVDEGVDMRYTLISSGPKDKKVRILDGHSHYFMAFERGRKPSATHDIQFNALRRRNEGTLYFGQNSMSYIEVGVNGSKVIAITKIDVRPHDFKDPKGRRFFEKNMLPFARLLAEEVHHAPLAYSNSLLRSMQPENHR